MNQNIDLNEINKFSKLANEWWDPNGKCKPLHTINPLRVDYICQSIGELAELNILDVGCGGGILCESLAKLGAKVTGIDMAEQSLMVAKEHAKQSQLSIEYTLSSVEEFAKTHTEQFDIITCMELLEHVPSPQSIIDACYKLLKPNGKLFLSTINRNYKAKLLLIFGAEYIANIIPKGTHDFERFIRPSELMAFIEQAKLTTKELMGMQYHLLTNQFKLGNNIEINYILLAEKLIY